MHNNQNGSSLLIVVVVMAAIGLLVVAGLQIYEANSTTANESNSCTGILCGLDKPVIYLYPEEPQTINVKLELTGSLMYSYPQYNESAGGWQILAEPDGTLWSNDIQYSYLFWEGTSDARYDLSTGFVVPGEEVEEFLQTKLSTLGLLPKEYNEMVVYWAPRMKNNRYNLIHFAGSQYTENAKLTITPTPDSILRVFMVFKPLDNYISVEPQPLNEFTREGFTVVEWGGSEVR